MKLSLILNGKREYETARELQYDDDEDYIANNYKNLED